MRSSSAALSAAPFRRARFASPLRRVTSTSTGEPPWCPASATRDPFSPKRISWASARVRGEKPCVARWRLSSRFVLPAPFAPTARTRPGLELELEPRVRAVVAGAQSVSTISPA